MKSSAAMDRRKVNSATLELMKNRVSAEGGRPTSRVTISIVRGRGRVRLASSMGGASAGLGPSPRLS